MPRDGRETKEKIFEATQVLFLKKGYAGTSVENIIEAVGITKGAFFYHFKSKEDLAKALIERYAESDKNQYYKIKEKAKALTRDPLQQFLIMLVLLKEEMKAMGGANPGCLYASYCYQMGVIHEEAMNIVTESIRFWRDNILGQLQEIAKQYPPRIPVNLNALSILALTTFEGAYVLSKTLNDPDISYQQIEQFHQYVELLFSPEYQPRSNRSGVVEFSSL